MSALPAEVWENFFFLNLILLSLPLQFKQGTGQNLSGAHFILKNCGKIKLRLFFLYGLNCIVSLRPGLCLTYAELLKCLFNDGFGPEPFLWSTRAHVHAQIPQVLTVSHGGCSAVTSLSHQAVFVSQPWLCWFAFFTAPPPPGAPLQWCLIPPL